METPTLHLQGIGALYAVAASEIKPFDQLVWNYGADTPNPVTEIRYPSPQYLQITEEHGGTAYTRKLKRSRLVVVRSLHQAYISGRRTMRQSLKETPKSAAELGELLDYCTAQLAGNNQLITRKERP